MIPSSTMLAGAAFIALAAVNVSMMLEASRPTCTGIVRSRLIALHRFGGYLFVILLCIMAWIMSKRLLGVGLSKAPGYVIVHVALTLVLVPLVTLKILIARRYRHLYLLLRPLGLAISASSFVLVSLPLLSQALQSDNPGRVGSRVTLVFAAALCVFLCGLWLSRMRKRRVEVPDESRSSVAPVVGMRSTNPQEVTRTPMTLLLAQIEQQTYDTKTLRFLIPTETRLRARPGQFLTFHWFVKGKRVLRSYTISSSPAHPEHVEITAKRIENGCVSNFLHDEAKLGLAVEASGPHGKFYFDEAVHQSVVLIAAGSGITPMISIIRYVDDLRLPTPVTLLYCVRTSNDIIFEAELERLRNSIPNFNYCVTLSQPHDNWMGKRGHLTREVVFEHVNDLNAPTFFLCGPKGFMDSARQILTTAGVDESRITQESFGEKPVGKGPNQTHAKLVETIEFVRSQKTCAIPAGSTLLEAAEANGVDIPFGCRQGQCGTCATRVLCGNVQMDTDAGLTDEQRNGGYVLPCVSRAKGNVELVA